MKEVVIIIVFGIYYLGAGCSGISKLFYNDQGTDKLKEENAFLRVSQDSLSESYESLFREFTAIKNKKPDTVFVFNPVDSIKWIDSVRYVFMDSVIYSFKDSTIFSYRDSILYNNRDSINVSYDDRTFPEDSVVRYLNLFFRTDDAGDTAGLHFNFEVFDGSKLYYQRDSLYRVPDSITAWRIDWWREGKE